MRSPATCHAPCHPQSGNGFTSGRINTKPTAAFWPGMQLQDGTTFSSVHIEARVQLPPPGQALWPAFWLFPSELYYGKWAASGEIDVLESVRQGGAPVWVAGGGGGGGRRAAALATGGLNRPAARLCPSTRLRRSTT